MQLLSTLYTDVYETFKKLGHMLKPGIQLAIPSLLPCSEGPMRSKVQFVVCAEDGQEKTGHETTVIDKACQRIEHLAVRAAGSSSGGSAAASCIAFRDR
jgi:hypothetical protein